MRPLWRKVLGPALRALAASVRGMTRDQASLLAAGLTYMSLMALIPLLSVLFAVLGALGVKGKFEVWLQGAIGGMPDQFQPFLEQILALVQKVNIGGLGALALLLLIYTVLNLMGKIEGAFNRIWRARKGRNLTRRYADYAALLFFVPILVLAATGLNTVLQIEPAIEDLDKTWPWLAGIVRSGLAYVPMAMLAMAATLLFKVMPNAKVRWLPAAISGLLTGVGLFGAQWLFSRFQIGISQANAIYGSLAFLPLFLIFLHVSWSLVLWGGELSFAIQYIDRAGLDADERAASPVRRRLLGFQLLRDAERRFAEGKSLRLSDFCSSHGWSRSEVDGIRRALVDGGLLHGVALGDAVVPARAPGETEVRDLLQALDGREPPLDLAKTGLDDKDLRRLAEVRKRATQVDGRF